MEPDGVQQPSLPELTTDLTAQDRMLPHSLIFSSSPHLLFHHFQSIKPDETTSILVLKSILLFYILFWWQSVLAWTMNGFVLSVEALESHDRSEVCGVLQCIRSYENTRSGNAATSHADQFS